MRTLKLPLTLLFILASFTTALASEIPKGQALVTFKAPEGLELSAESITRGPIRQHVDQIAESLGARVTVTYGSLSLAGRGRRILAMVVSDTLTTDELIQALEAHPEVLAARRSRESRIMH